MAVDPCISPAARARLDRFRQSVARAGRAGEGADRGGGRRSHARARPGRPPAGGRAGRPNVIGVLEGREPGPTLMFCGHLDTVGVEGMDRAVRSGRARRPALRPRLAGHEGGRRGDDRRGRVAVERGFLARPLVVAAVIDERVREHRRRCAGHALESRRGGRDRTDRSARSAWRTRGLPGSTWKPAAVPRTAAARATAAMRSSAWDACCSASRRSIASCSRGRRTR